jgi:hypothetical protein
MAKKTRKQKQANTPGNPGKSKYALKVARRNKLAKELGETSHDEPFIELDELEPRLGLDNLEIELGNIKPV